MAAVCIRMWKVCTLPHTSNLVGQTIPLITRQLLFVNTLNANITQASVRNAGFFNRVTAQNLWDGIHGVSNAGKKRGRGKRTGNQRRVDLNRGQVVGSGEKNMVWPGLNAPVFVGKRLSKVSDLPTDPERLERIHKVRSRGYSMRSFKMAPLQRGWTGRKLPGTSLGPPDSIGDYQFTGFDSRVLEYKMVATMTGNMGRRQQYSAFVVTGNKNGLAGYGLAKSANGRAALRKAKNLAGQRLQHVERYQNHTIFHNFYSKEQQTAILAKKVAKGHGLICHRALKTTCEVMGIDDLYAKVEGSSGNIQNLTKAFFKGLRQQETHQELADRTKLYVVEFRPERSNYPIVTASPTSEVRVKGEKEEEFDMENAYFNNRVPLQRPKKEPTLKGQQRAIKHKAQKHKRRNQYASKLDRMVLGAQPSHSEIRIRLRPLKGSRDG